MREWFRAPAWISPEAKAVWEPKLRAVSQAWATVEREAVVRRRRPACLILIRAEELPGVSAWAAKTGLVVSVLQEQRLGTGSYSVGAAPDGARGYRVAVHQNGLQDRWHTVWEEENDPAIGALLGFPQCCREFFYDEWIKKGSRDTTHAAAALAGPMGTETADGPPGANLLLRWLGVRLVPHLACSFQCEGTLKVAAQMERTFEELGLTRELAWAREALSWPAEYTALHGSGQVRLPWLKFSFSTDYTPGLVSIRRTGPSPTLPDEPWRDNDFATEEAMDAAHAVVVAAAEQLPPGDGFLDLGAGDGSLLAELGCGAGIERDAGRVLRGQRRHPEIRLREGDIRDVDSWPWVGPTAVPILMPGRLTEMKGEEVREVLDAGGRLPGDQWLVYAYGDWLKEGGLAALCQRAGLPEPTGVIRGEGAEAGVISWK